MLGRHKLVKRRGRKIPGIPSGLPCHVAVAQGAFAAAGRGGASPPRALGQPGQPPRGNSAVPPALNTSGVLEGPARAPLRLGRAAQWDSRSSA